MKLLSLLILIIFPIIIKKSIEIALRNIKLEF